MNVPPFIPPQLEVSQNVAEEKYPVRTLFVKRVVLIHSTFALILIGCSSLAIVPSQMEAGASLVLLSLMLLSLVRGLAKGWRHEQLLSTLCVPVLIAGMAVTLKAAAQMGLPWWVPAVVPAAMVVYVTLCGRDLSFVGMFFIGSAFVTGATLIGYLLGEYPQLKALELWLALETFALYYVYNLAALQTRRRLGEEVGAVLDLFRDLLNFTTYPIRVVNHWRRHRIWSSRS